MWSLVVGCYSGVKSFNDLIYKNFFRRFFILKVLVACEESQVVCKAFREKGHEAYSCDIIECSGGHPEWHIKGDVLDVLNPVFHSIGFIPDCDLIFGIGFFTMDGILHYIDKWDLIITHPPWSKV